jgi:uncharacterized protein YdeI (YjbR/CyaY-like superfamily)
MMKAGLQKVREARQNGQWDAAITREQLLHWFLTARSQATRQRRLEAILREAAKG